MSAPASSAPAVQPLPADHTLLYLANLPFSLTQEELTQFIAQNANAQVRIGGRKRIVRGKVEEEDSIAIRSGSSRMRSSAGDVGEPAE